MNGQDHWTAGDLGLTEREALELGALVGLSAGPRRPPPGLRARVLGGLARRPTARRPRPLALAALAAAAALLAVLPLRVPAPLGYVAGAGGRVRVDGRPVGAGQRLEAGQVVSVEDGEAVLVFDGGRAAARLLGGAEVALGGGRTIEVELRRGWLLSAVATGTPYRVVTAHGRVSALGTDFMTRLEPSETFVCICRGRLELSGGFGRSEVVSRAHGAWVFTASRVPRPPAQATMDGHSEDDLRSLRAFLEP